MIEWESTGDTIRAVDAVKNELVMETAGWERRDYDEQLDRPTDVEFAGVLSRLTLPLGHLRVYDLTTGETMEDRDLLGDGQLQDRPYLAIHTGPLHVYLKFEGPAFVDVVDEDTELHISFPDRGFVHFGIRSYVRAPSDTITVPRTLDGVAAAITHSSSAHRTMSPDRTFYTMRRHPPAVEFGDDYEIPRSVRAETPDTGIEVVVPESLRALFLTAPLAYYLGAEVSIEEGATPRVLAPAADVNFRLGPSLVEAVPETLSRVFWFDCLARNGGPHGIPDLVEHDLLSHVGIDHETAYEASPADRLSMYLDAPYTLVKDDFPDWPLAMHVDPTMSNVESLPFLLNRLSFIYPPETAELEGKELMERSLDDFYREPPGPIASVEMLKPKLRRGRIHGWLADGTPIDVFKTLPEAYENHLEYLGTGTNSGGEMSVVVVLNDKDMAGEHDRVAEIYEERAADSGMNVRFEEELTRRELADLFAEPHEFLHYIGHCEVDGLRCADGNLAVSSLDETNVQTFFLNACGSYYEGLDLVRKGSVAGAVTFRKVLDEQAAKVGTAFARLLVSGFPIETALRLARRRIMMGKDYAVVGNGMQNLSKKDTQTSSVAYVDTQKSGDLQVSWDVYATASHGGYYQMHLEDVTQPRLTGNHIEFSARPDELVDFLDGEDMPVILDGEFYWSDEVVEKYS